MRLTRSVGFNGQCSCTIISRIEAYAERSICACSYAVDEAEMVRKGRHDAGCLFMGDSARGAPEKLPGSQHGLEVSRLRQIKRIVLLCVKHAFVFKRLLQCSFS